MKVGEKSVVYANISFETAKEIVKIDTECVSHNKLIYCLTCDAVVVSSEENTHTKFHEKIFDLEERLEDLERK